MSECRLRIVYMGTAAFAVPALDALVRAGHEVAYAVTQPDRMRGRGNRVVPTPVGSYADERGIPSLKPENLNEESFTHALAEAAPDLIVVAAYGNILPKPLLEAAKLGCVNIHASLLPEYRGAAPVQRALFDGKTLAGVTLMYMAEGLDTGDMIAAAEVDIGDMNAGELTEALAQLGAKLLMRSLPDIMGGTAARTPQDEAKATYAVKTEKAEGRLDMRAPAGEIVRRVRAMTPAPGAYVFHGGERVGVTAARALSAGEWAMGAGGRALGAGEREPHMAAAEPAARGRAKAPGTILAVSDEGVIVQTGDGVLVIQAIKAPGKRAMAVADYLKGNTFSAALPLE